MHRALVLAMLLPLPLPAGADATRLSAALEAYSRGELSRSLGAFEEALRAGSNDAAGLRQIYVHLGILRAGRRDASGAELAFAALLSLDPDAALPASSPVLLRPFERARAARGAAPALGVDLEAPEAVTVGAPIAIAVRVAGDTSQLVKSARARIAAGPSRAAVVEATGNAPYSIALPLAATSQAGDVPWTVELVDEWGSVLVSTEPRRVHVEAPAPPPAVRLAIVPEAPARHARPHRPVRRPARGSWLSSPWFWSGAVAVVGGAVAVAVLASQGSGKAAFGKIGVERQ